MLDRFNDGVWFVELAPLTDPQLIAENITALFGFPIGAGQRPLDAVVGLLREKQALLILDNCEHLVAAVASLAEAIIRKCPNMALLASSREPLAISGEAIYRVPTLGFPDRPEGITAEAALGYGAVRLFAQRAGAAVAGFAVANDNAPAVAEICRRLDGVALAIELAAPRLKMLKPEELVKHLDDRFRILTGSRTALPRQQTLKALIDWSYDLLSGSEQILLRRVSVFAGGWTLGGAIAVAAGAPLQGWEIFDLLGSLVDKSLVVADFERQRNALPSARIDTAICRREAGGMWRGRLAPPARRALAGVLRQGRGSLAHRPHRRLAPNLRARTGQSPCGC